MRCGIILGQLALTMTLAAGSAPAEAPPIDTALDRALANAPTHHPRLFISAADLATLPQRAQASPRLTRLRDAVLREAEAALQAPLPQRHLDGRRLLAVSRDVLARTLHLATAYHLTGDTRFARGAATNLITVCAFTDWNPSHFLDVAEMTLAVAIGYDWLHAQLSESELNTLRDAIVNKGFAPSWESELWWVRCEHNWNQVCHAGLAAGAIALLTEAPDEARRILLRAIESVPVAMQASYAPDGAYPEGPIYWDYGTSFNVLLVAMLEQALGSSFGLAEAPGFMASADYYCHVTAPSGLVFNYADSRGEQPTASVPIFWFAQRLQRPELATVHTEILDAQLAAHTTRNRLLPLLLFWLTDTAPTRPLPLDWSGHGLKPVAMHRRDWSPTAPYAAIVAGTPGSNHAHMDVGSFIFEAHGIRWALDLGMLDYARLEALGVGLWDKRQGGDRWKLFRYGTSGHNTLMIEGQNQRVEGRGSLKAFSADAACPFSVVEMNNLYEGQAASVTRGLRMPDRTHLVVVDSLTGLSPGATVRWAMLTPAVASVDGATATLQKAGRQIVARVLTPDAARWQVTDVSQPHSPWDEPNPGVAQLTFTCTAPADGSLRVVVLVDTGLAPPPTEGQIAAWGPPETWASPQPR